MIKLDLWSFHVLIGARQEHVRPPEMVFWLPLQICQHSRTQPFLESEIEPVFGRATNGRGTVRTRPVTLMAVRRDLDADLRVALRTSSVLVPVRRYASVPVIANGGGQHKFQRHAVLPTRADVVRVHSVRRTTLRPVVKSDSAGLSAGERIKLRRLRSGLSRQVVANLVGRSEEWLRLVETGRQTLDSMRTMARLANVLHIDDLSQLVDWPLPQLPVEENATPAVLTKLRSVIMDHPAMTVYADIDWYGQPAPAASAELCRCEEIWASSPNRYSVLAQRLPDLLASCRALHRGARSAETSDLVVRVYHLSRQLLNGTGAHDLARIVADRAMTVAADDERSIVMSASAWQAGNALLCMSSAQECYDYALAAVRWLSKSECADDGDSVSLRGSMHVLAARGAAAMHDPLEAERQISLAQQLVRHRGGDHRVYGIVFGPTEVGIARMEIALSRLDFDQTIRIAAEVDVVDEYPIDGHTRYQTALAYAFVCRGEDVASAFSLEKAAQACPEALRYDVTAHRALRSLILRDNPLVRRDVAQMAALAAIS